MSISRTCQALAIFEDLVFHKSSQVFSLGKQGRRDYAFPNQLNLYCLKTIILSITITTLIKNMKNQEDWEGFQTFNQDIKIIQEQDSLVPIFSLKKNVQPQKTSLNLLHLEKKRIKKSLLVAAHKQKDIFKHFIQEKETTLGQLPKNNQINLSRRVSQGNKVEMKCMAKINEVKYEKIPICRPQSNPYSLNGCSGTTVYRGFAPKESDKYLLEYWNEKKSLKEERDVSKNNCPFSDVEFNSKFQSGNLSSAVKIRNNEYNLFLKVDTNTEGHRQWFYFSVKVKTPKLLKFNLFRFRKKFSLFQNGMKPYTRDSKHHEHDWKPAGTHVRYCSEDELDDNLKKSANKNSNRSGLYYLSFVYEFKNQNSEIYFASSIPYTYTYLERRILELSFQVKQENTQHIDRLVFKESLLCKTLSGLKVPLLTIMSEREKQRQPKRFIIINARTHPGETSSSWVLDGIISSLSSNAKVKASIIKNNVVFQIVPMLNPDGVLMGNYRTGVMGVDYNRLFLSANEEMYPEILSLKKLVKDCKKKGTIDLYLDLHGHSILANSFIFGPNSNQFSDSNFKFLPKILRDSSKYFSIENCRESSDVKKIETSRIYFQLREEILSMTCENSLGLYSDENLSTAQCTAEDWRMFGEDLASALCQIYEKDQIKVTQDWMKFDLPGFNTKKQHQRKLSSFSEDSDQDLFVWKKYKTDQNLEKEIGQMLELQKKEIQLKTSEQIKSSFEMSQPKMHSSMVSQKIDEDERQDDSSNDSDGEADDLNEKQKKQLYSFVRSNLQKNKDKEGQLQPDSEKQAERLDDLDFLASFKKGQPKGKSNYNFKQYKFGVNEDSGMNLANWERHKRLLSLPKCIKNQTQTSSFLIRKKQKIDIQADSPPNNIDIFHRLRTEPNTETAKSSALNRETSNVFKKYNDSRIYQKQMHRMLVNRKHLPI